ncbi:MAG: hypothetical protein R3C53_20385 [Pirellulaceae bacterium]
MGLDTVELAMEVEESFGITIPDGRACEMRTVGGLFSFILAETRDQTRDPISCLSAATFYDLRRRLVSQIENANSLRPGTGDWSRSVLRFAFITDSAIELPKSVQTDQYWLRYVGTVEYRT